MHQHLSWLYSSFREFYLDIQSLRLFSLPLMTTPSRSILLGRVTCLLQASNHEIRGRNLDCISHLALLLPFTLFIVLIPISCQVAFSSVYKPVTR